LHPEALRKAQTFKPWHIGPVCWKKYFATNRKQERTGNILCLMKNLGENMDNKPILRIGYVNKFIYTGFASEAGAS
jgi:hypothetical protein